MGLLTVILLLTNIATGLIQLGEYAHRKKEKTVEKEEEQFE